MPSEHAGKKGKIMSFELSQEEGKFLITLARNTVKEYLEEGKAPEPPKDTPKKLFEHCGVFVTINRVLVVWIILF